MITNSATHLFETPLGWCGFAWGSAGIFGLVLPMRDRPSVERRLADIPSGFAGAAAIATASALEWANSISRYYLGEPTDFGGIPVDLMARPAFDRAILTQTLRLGYAETTTYGELAARAGFPGMAREAGAALGHNPVPLIVPCHRVVAAGGRIGGFSAPGGAATKKAMLAMEGISLDPVPAQASFGF